MQVVVFNLVLSGDNTLIVALAAPPDQRRAVLLLGIAAAIVLRVALTVLTLRLLILPGVRAAGRIILLGVAVRLPAAEKAPGEALPRSSSALRSIPVVVLADLAMSLDNVVGVAAAARGSFVLLTLGLALSIPLLVFGSSVLVRWMRAVPMLVTLGAAVLGFVAGEMLVSDPITADWMRGDEDWLRPILPALCALGVALIAFRIRGSGADEQKPDPP